MRAETEQCLHTGAWVGIDKDFQEYMQFYVGGELFQCGALPFGWNDSPRIFVKFMQVLAECLRSPRAAEKRREVRKLRDGSTLEAFRARKLASRVLTRLGIERNEKKRQWEPTQLVEHLDLAAGQFRVTLARLQKIHVQAKALLSEASRQRRWLPARRHAGFTGLCQSVYLAVPPARLYLRELYFVLSTKRGWGSKVKLTLQAWTDVEWWLRLPAQSWWNGRKIWRSPTRAKLHTDSSLFAWGGVLNLKHAARGFWGDELRHLHITHLELEAVYKTVQSFLRELTGKVDRLYCDNQAVVAMLSHFTSRNPELMRRMRRLWLLLDLNDIELQARYIRSEANEWADRLSRDKDLDDRRLNRRWFDWADMEWHKHNVDCFASEISTQLPRYYAQWYDPGCEGVDSLAYSWLVEVNWPIDNAWYPGKVGDTDEHSMTRVTYDDGDVEILDMHTEQYRVIPPAKGERVDEWDTALEGRWRKATVRLYIVHVTSKGTIKAASLQPYLSAVNNYHEDMGFDGAEMELQRACTYAVFAFDMVGRPDTGVSMQKSRIAVADGNISVVLHKEKGRRHVRLKRRLTIPAAGVKGLVQLLEHWQGAKDGGWQRTSSPCGEAEGTSYGRLP
ncbi:hypothetical protein CYMTET_25214 [Cymbomonas tetramitiformis]|uniref:RNase H type-1 domain-containing protein n=1 Tax=Cymbomonas tetramitiformis TaxID=36881 RepID=A0AAE0FU83_9CHLO|nr:hypothetical protein CYMTET_25214 [Cymbomonas tetramitiformis]